jgi:hypothetical protein
VNSALYPVYPGRFARRSPSRDPLAPRRSSTLASYSHRSSPNHGTLSSRLRVCPFNFRLPAFGALLSPFFSAFPYRIRLTPLSTAFTHFDRGGMVRTFPTLHVQTFRSADPSFHQLTNRSSRNSFVSKTIRVAGVGPLSSSAVQPVTGQEPQVTPFQTFAASWPLFGAFFTPRLLYFQQLADTFLRTPGVGQCCCNF